MRTNNNAVLLAASLLLGSKTIMTTTTALSSSSSSLLRAIKMNFQRLPNTPIIAYERNHLDQLTDHALEENNFHGTLGWQAWPSGFVAANQTLELLFRSSSTTTINKVLELGCGTGLPSLAAYLSCKVDHVVATDLQVDLVKRSLAANKNPSNKATTTFRCVELDLLADTSNTPSCVDTFIRNEQPGLIIAADCLYDASLAQAVGRIMGTAVAASSSNVTVLVADPGRLNGRGRSIFLQHFLECVVSSQQQQEEVVVAPEYFVNVETPQDDLRNVGASLSWCGVQETKVGVFIWPPPKKNVSS